MTTVFFRNKPSSSGCLARGERYSPLAFWRHDRVGMDRPHRHRRFQSAGQPGGHSSLYYRRLSDCISRLDLLLNSPPPCPR